MMAFLSVAILEKFALLKIALWSAPVLRRASWCRTSSRLRAGMVLRALPMRAGQGCAELHTRPLFVLRKDGLHYRGNIGYGNRAIEGYGSRANIDTSSSSSKAWDRSRFCLGMG